jgi:citrate synthase
MLLGAVGALSTFYPDAKNIHDENARAAAIRLIAKMPTIAAFAYRHSHRLPYVYPDNDLGYAGNFLSMMFKMAEPKYEPNPVLERALDVLFILHADHEQNCSTTRAGVGSSQADPYSAVAGGIAALYGPLHGGANEAVLKMLDEIGDVENVPLHRGVKNKGKGRLMGFGHRVYKNYDPRAKIIKKIADEVFEVTGQEPAARHRARARADRARGRVLRQAQALPERRLLLGPDLPGDGLPVAMFTGAVRDPAHCGLDRAVGGDADDPEQKIARRARSMTRCEYV